MKSQFSPLVFLLLIPAIVFANDGKFKGKYTKEKTLKKEYTVNANANLHVNNSYGNLDIVTWNENRTVIEVTIKTNGNNEEKVQQKLDEITVEFSGSSSNVSAKTLFKKNKTSWSLWGNKDNNVSMEVNYTIKLPVTNSVDLYNDYGAINLNRLQGKAKINCDYGQLIIGELMADGNHLEFDYTDKSTIAYMKSGKIDADYSGFTLEKGEQLELNADYTNSEINEINDLKYDCDYGKVTVRNARKINGSGDYVTHRIGTISGSLALDSDYGSIVVERLSASVKDVNIKSDYTGVKIGFDASLAFDFNIKLSYGSLKGEDEVTVTHSDKNHSNKSYRGYHKSPNSGASISISSNYGGITLNKI